MRWNKCKYKEKRNSFEGYINHYLEVNQEFLFSAVINKAANYDLGRTYVMRVFTAEYSSGLRYEVCRYPWQLWESASSLEGENIH